MNEIIIVSVTTPLSGRIKRILSSENLRYPIYECDLFEVVDAIKHEIRNGTKVIVSRGGTAELIRQNYPVPVIDIHHDYFGVHNVVQDALCIATKVAVVAFPLYAEIMRNYALMIGKEINIYEIKSRDDIEGAIKKLVDDKCGVVIGGLTVSKIANKHGIPSVMGDADDISIRQALAQARHTLKYVNDLEMQFHIVNGILDCVNEGIVGLNANGNVFQSNFYGRKLLGCSYGDNAKNMLPNTDFINIISSGKPSKNKVIETGKNTLIINSAPIVVDGFSYGTVLTIQEEEYIRDISHKLRLQHAQKGHVAKTNFEQIIGSSVEIAKAKEKAQKFALSESSILIYGETGTGKELFAQSIHNFSRRQSAAFVAVNCAALPQTVLESELFGYVKGAFTGARDSGKPGIFELANKGTVFLDEIGEIPTDVQAKLLRVIQEKEVTRLGDDKVTQVDVRIVAATNKRLSEEVRNGKFREDLYYRLNTLELYLPPLRDRISDISELINYFLKKFNRPEIVFSLDAIRFIQEKRWPGNIRQFENLIERITVIFEKNFIVDEDIIDLFLGGESLSETASSSELKLQSEVRISDENILENMERKLIEQTLKITKGSRERASIILGISTTTLWRKIRQYKISATDQ